jgi:hypothetical protein
MEKIRVEKQELKETMDKEIKERDQMIKHLNERIEKIRIELKKAVLLLKQRTQQ